MPTGAARVRAITSSAHVRRLLLVAAFGAWSWAALVALNGGLRLRTPWGLVTSHSAARPLVFGAVVMATYLIWWRRYLGTDIAPARRLGRPPFALTIAMGAALACGVHWSSFLAAGPDASGYISQAELWRQGHLTLPAPEWLDEAAWPEAARAAAPVGYRPGAHGQMAPTYPPGLPVLMAAFHVVGGPQAVFLVVPLFGALAVAATYWLGRHVAGPPAGGIAAILLVTSPAFLIMLVQPMSDVPAAACWGAALAAAFSDIRARGAVAGLSSSLAILIRPNVTPLAAIVAVALVCGRRTSGARAVQLLMFVATTSTAFVVLALINRALFGSPFESGYGAITNLYSAADVVPNLMLYGGAMFRTQTPAILAAFALPLLLPRTDPRWRAAVVLALVVPAAVLGLYLPYERVKVWWFLRFLLPAYPALLASLAGVIVLGESRLPRRLSSWLPAILTGVLAVHGVARAAEAGVFRIRDADQRYAAACQYADQLPPGAVLVSEVHNGTLHFYTGRDVLRWKIIRPSDIDRALDTFRRAGRPVYLVADEFELDGFRERFRGARVLEDLQPEFVARLPADVVVYPLAGSHLP